MKLITLLIWLKLLIINSQLLAQNNIPRFPDIQFQKISSKDGISENTGLAITQDKLGVMWFGTEDGLNRYDGYSIEVFRHNPNNINSISHNYITSLTTDRDGFIWVGTKRGLNKINPYSFEIIRYLSTDLNRLILDDHITELFLDKEENMWVGTNFGRLSCIDTKNISPVKFHRITSARNPLSINSIYEIMQDSNDNIWIGATTGIYIIKNSSNEITRFPEKEDFKNKIPNTNIFALKEDQNKDLWIGTSTGLSRIDFDSLKVSHFKLNPHRGEIEIRTIHQDNFGRIWVGSYGYGIYMYDQETEHFHNITENKYNPKALSSNDVRIFYEDCFNNLWIGVNAGAINKIEVFEDFIYYSHPSNYSNPIVHSFLKDKDGDFWLGTRNGLNFKKEGQKSFTALNDYYIRSIVEDADGTIWVGTRNEGVLQYVKTHHGHIESKSPLNSSNSNLNSNSIWTLHVDVDNNLWIGSYGGGLQTYSIKKKSFLPELEIANDLIGHNKISCIEEDNQGNLWFGTWEGGINKVLRNERKIYGFNHILDSKNGFKTDHVWSILIDKNEHLWIGTWGNGLIQFDPKTNSVKNFNSNNSRIANDVIYGLLEDRNGKIWMSSNSGISILDPILSTFQNLEYKDGLQDKEFNAKAYYADQDGYFYFGGINGFNYFIPENIIRNKNNTPPKILIDRIKIYDKEKDQWKEQFKNIGDIDKSGITLDSKQTFSVIIKPIHFKNPTKNTIDIKLIKNNEEVLEGGNSMEPIFRNLSPGKYKLSIKAMNADGLGNEKAFLIPFYISPSSMMDYPYVPPLLVFLGSFILFGVLSFFKNIHTKNRIKAINNAYKSGAKSERNIMTSRLHDIVMQNINDVGRILVSIKDEKNRKSIVQAVNTLGETTTNIRAALGDINLSDQVDEIGLKDSLEKLIKKQCMFNPNIDFELDWNIRENLIDNIKQREIFLICNQAISNAMEHSSGNKICLLFEIDVNDNILIQVKDNGYGFKIPVNFNDLKTDQHFGLWSMNERANSIGAKLMIEQLGGTVVKLSLAKQES